MPWLMTFVQVDVERVVVGNQADRIVLTRLVDDFEHGAWRGFLVELFEEGGRGKIRRQHVVIIPLLGLDAVDDGKAVVQQRFSGLGVVNDSSVLAAESAGSSQGFAFVMPGVAFDVRADAANGVHRQMLHYRVSCRHLQYTSARD